ncbi:DNA topoisomerase IB [Sediminibacterium ginsengisoli]|uniref:DNA topoisomerase n=1 Tax=Sediminibacterium ginsengisoli TaxID=413434 RepID=A0A1T4Q204_9BACT|nr:DNA topoisomerase IB [Sediminibacterium ginsengisoli]SJZ97531.1 DNA topoisomerase-1 [Sediminibacterium ginsengisoli]
MEKISIPHQKHLKLARDYYQAAKAAHLVYVTDRTPGIRRIKKGKGFSYHFNNTIIKAADELSRIRSLAIPPAWTEVWICRLDNGHIQATGYDARKRKQYRYHAQWNHLRNETKFHRMIEFGKALPAIRKQLEKDLALKDLCERKVLATVISLMERTYIRVGNSIYEKENGSFGLTTLHDEHVHISGNDIRFSFTGKTHIHHEVSIRNRKLAKIVKECRDIPGKELFQYYNDAGERKPIDSGSVNAYIKEITGEDFTAKDFRTWAGSLHALEAIGNLEQCEEEKGKKQQLTSVLEYVSSKLGNTKAVCRKYYIHPVLLKYFEPGKNTFPEIKNGQVQSGLNKQEQVLLHILENLQ